MFARIRAETLPRKVSAVNAETRDAYANARDSYVLVRRDDVGIWIAYAIARPQLPRLLTLYCKVAEVPWAGAGAFFLHI
jgi:hypothetical protein